jgi:hypothetical protein
MKRDLMMTLGAPAPRAVRVASEVNSGRARAGQRFQGHLDTGLPAGELP